MGRVTQMFPNNNKISGLGGGIAWIIVVVGIVAAFWSHGAKPPAGSAVNTQPANYVFSCDPAYKFVYYYDQNGTQVNYVDYQGKNGQTALAILEKCATVGVKHYSFGDQVISIDGSVGNGPKYWSFYINNHLADVGAGSYQTKNSDNISWELQAL